MTEDSSLSDALERIVESFIERQRRGERPTMSEYLERHPELAGEIRSVFPSLELLEELGSSADSPSRLELDGDPGPAEPPRRLGDYRIVREIGRGGMGIVYEAIQESLGRQVALKVLPWTRGRNPVLEERFRREAQAAARLHHSNIVPIFSVGEEEGVFYYAMQFIPGQSLESVLRELCRVQEAPGGPAPRPTRALGQVAESLASGTLSLVSLEGVDADDSSQRPGVEEPSSTSRLGDVSSVAGFARYFRNVAEIGAQVATALQYAHSHGVVHRDIKPGNLMLDIGGTPWITDFGLAKADGSDELTGSGDVLGTLRYMAPEQFAGQADARSDIYSLGLTLYELVTLRPAFEDPVRVRLIDRIQKEEPVRPAFVDPRVPRDLETILLKSIAKEPRDRYASAGELAADLRAFLEDRPIAARRMNGWERSLRWFRRNHVVASLGASLLALLLVAAVASTWTASVMVAQRDEARASRAEARRQLRRSKLNEARAITVSGRAGQRLGALAVIQEVLADRAAGQMSPPERYETRAIAASALVLPDLETVRSWKDDESHVDAWDNGFDFDVAMRRYVARLSDGTVVVRRVDDNGEIFKTKAAEPRPFVYLSPSGRRLAMIDRLVGWDRLSVWDLGADGIPLLYQNTVMMGYVAALSPDDRRVAYYRDDLGVEIVDLATGRVDQIPCRASGGWEELAFDPTGQKLAYVIAAKGGNALVIHTIDGSQPDATIRLGSGIDGLCWHPLGKTIAVGCSNRRIFLVDVATATGITTLYGHPARRIGVQFNSKGNRILSNDSTSHLRVWDTSSENLLLTIPSQGRTLRAGLGDLVATRGDVHDGRLRLLRLHGGDEIRTLAWPGAERLNQDGVILSPVDHLAWISCVRTTLGNNRGLAAVGLSQCQVQGVVVHPSAYPFAGLEDGSVLTSGPTGIHRWPRAADKTGKHIAFGPPTLLSPVVVSTPPASSVDGSVIAGIIHKRAFVLVRKGRTDKTVDSGLDYSNWIATSPNGKLVAVSNSGTGVDAVHVKIFDADTAECVASLSTDARSDVGFSPDSQWFWASGGSANVWRVGQWDRKHEIGGTRLSFARDGRTVAIGDTVGKFRILRRPTWEPLVEITLPNEETLLTCGFTGDGAGLLVYSARLRATYLVDLRRIRTQLADLGLDWDEPPLPSEPSIIEPAKVEWRTSDAQPTDDSDRL